MADSILIAAALAHRAGYGGHAWALLQYVLGFRELGFEVTVVDRLEPGMVPEGTEQVALDYLDRLLEPERIPYSVLDGRGGSRAGLPYEEALARAAEARFLLNVMGFVRDWELLEATRRRVFLDIDPGFPQIWRELELADVFVGHDDFVTVGRNVGREGCAVPNFAASRNSRSGSTFRFSPRSRSTRATRTTSSFCSDRVGGCSSPRRLPPTPPPTYGSSNRLWRR
jgi:hypothetical protein